MSKRLSLSQARDLIKRELGISAAALTAPEDMNSNSDYPWYEMHLGTTRIEINTNDVRQGKFTDKMIGLCVTRENSLKYTNEYFYGDTLEFAEIYTEWQNREVLCETMENPENDTVLRRLKREAQDDCWEHFHGQPVMQENKAHHIAEVHSDKILEKAAFDNFQGKLLQGHDLFQIRVFDHHGNYIPESEVWPIDETQLDWWIKEVKHGVNNNPEKAAGFSVFQWDRKNESWMDYCPDGENQLRYDTGRRPDGIHKNLVQQLPIEINKGASISERLAAAQGKAELQNHKDNHKPEKHFER